VKARTIFQRPAGAKFERRTWTRVHIDLDDKRLSAAPRRAKNRKTEILLYPIELWPHESVTVEASRAPERASQPRAKSDRTAGAAESKPTKSIDPESVGSAIENSVAVSPTTASFAGIPVASRYRRKAWYG